MAQEHNIEQTGNILTIRTKPCWICGQNSYLNVPSDAWKQFDLYNIPLDIVWPDGPEADKQLIRTGVHPKCWDQEFPASADEKKEK